MRHIIQKPNLLKLLSSEILISKKNIIHWIFEFTVAIKVWKQTDPPTYSRFKNRLTHRLIEFTVATPIGNLLNLHTLSLLRYEYRLTHRPIEDLKKNWLTDSLNSLLVAQSGTTDPLKIWIYCRKPYREHTKIWH